MKQNIFNQFLLFQLSYIQLKNIGGGYASPTETNCKINCSDGSTRQCLRSITSCQADEPAGIIHCWYTDGDADFYECPST